MAAADKRPKVGTRVANRLSGFWSRLNLTADDDDGDRRSMHELGGSDTSDDEFHGLDHYTRASSPSPPSLDVPLRGKDKAANPIARTTPDEEFGDLGGHYRKDLDYHRFSTLHPTPPSPPGGVQLRKKPNDKKTAKPLARPKSAIEMGSYDAHASPSPFSRNPNRASIFQSLLRKSASPSTATLPKMAETGTLRVKERPCRCCLQYQQAGTGKPKKLRKCTDCKKEVCDACFGKEGGCHECYVRKVVQINPKDLLDLPEKVLRHFLTTLHYPAEPFVDVQKPFLVKQILSRFGVFEAWDPMFYLDAAGDDNPPVNNSPRRSIGSLESGASPARSPHPTTITTYEEPVREAPPPHTSQVQSKASFIDQLEKINKSRYTPESERKHSPGATAHPGTGEGGSSWNQGRPESPGSRNVVPLHKIATPKYFDGLTETELRDILRAYSIQASANAERHDLKYKVLQLWNIERKKVGIEPPPPSKPQFQGPSYGGGLPYQRSASPLQRTISLKDISSSSAIDSLSTVDMRTLLAKYNRKPENYVLRQDLIYEVRVLWNQAKRDALEKQNVIDDSKKFMVGQRSSQMMTPANRKWKSQDNLDDDISQPAPIYRSNSQYIQPESGGDRRQPPPAASGGGHRFPEVASSPTRRPYDRIIRDDTYAGSPSSPQYGGRMDPFSRGTDYSTLPRNYKNPIGQQPKPFQPRLYQQQQPPPPPPPPPPPVMQQTGVSKGKTPPPPPPMRGMPTTTVQRLPSKEFPPPPQSFLEQLQQQQRHHHQVPPQQQQQQQPQTIPFTKTQSVSLRDLRTLEDIPKLSLRQMIHILESHSVNTEGVDDKPELEELVKRLWFAQNRTTEVARKDDRPYLSYQQQQQQRHYADNTPGLEQRFERMTVTTTSSTAHHPPPPPPPPPQQQQPIPSYYSREEEVQHQQTGGRSFQTTSYQSFGGNDRSYSQARADMCVNCHKREADTILLDCGHMITCMQCAYSTLNCPQCGAPINQVMKAAGLPK